MQESHEPCSFGEGIAVEYNMSKVLEQGPNELEIEYIASLF